MGKTSIEWTDATWNPTAGCSRVSAGCDNCYAMRMARRHDGRGVGYDGTTRQGKRGADWTGVVNLLEGRLTDPLQWRKPCRVFVDSMSDLFHPAVPFEYVDRVFAVMALTPWHTFQILTKRPERMAEYFAIPEERQRAWGEAAVRLEGENEKLVRRALRDIYDDLFSRAHPIDFETLAWETAAAVELPLPNVWLGTSIENQAAADERVPHLLRCPAAVRFLSCEPLLGPVDVNAAARRVTLGEIFPNGMTEADRQRHLIGWVIVGGESGPGARPMHPDWARQIRDQCQAAGVAFHFKQWGNWRALTIDDPVDDWTRRDSVMLRPSGSRIALDQTFDPVQGDVVMVREQDKHAAGRMLDGRTWDEFPTAAEAQP